MINSMTGYGQAEGELDGVVYAVEIKSVNNRYFKAKMKLPDTAAFLEEDIERLLRSKLSRGMVSYVLWLKNISADRLFDIDETALRAYMERLGRLISSLDMDCSIDVGGLLELPGILLPVLPDEKTAEKVRQKVLEVTQEATERLRQMRAAEGAVLATEMDGYCRAIKDELEQIRIRSASAPQEYAKKLEKRVNELLADAGLELDEVALAREVAVFVDRSDITEEIARLESHLQQFAKTCEGSTADKQVGRRLDFICQEMLREANTIASKALDAEIIHWVVDIKCQIDRIKEQVQNIE